MDDLISHQIHILLQEDQMYEHLFKHSKVLNFLYSYIY